MWDNEVSDGEFEAYLAHVTQHMFDAERTTYERLSPLQSKLIPKLYGVVESKVSLLHLDENDDDEGEDCGEMVPGLLMEYVSSQTLRQVVQNWKKHEPPLPTEMLVKLCEEAVAVVDYVSDFDVLNQDVRLDNFLVRDPLVHPSLSLVKHPVVMIDLAQCRLRREDESEHLRQAPTPSTRTVSCRDVTVLIEYSATDTYK